MTNADVKITTKVLANRLKLVLPFIIHPTQTAVYGRRIDQKIHLVKNLIDIANRDNDIAAFIFVDQEKAFDRVNYTFLFKPWKILGLETISKDGSDEYICNISTGINFSQKNTITKGSKARVPL